MKPRFLSVFGTRPEAIKLAPLLRLLAQRDDCVSSVCVTGQHRLLLDQVLTRFAIKPDHDLDLMGLTDDLTVMTGATLAAVGRVIRRTEPDWVIVQGDTLSAYAAGMAAFYQGVRVAHVEAGLRTGDMAAPFPEEMHRRQLAQIASLHFAPTKLARDNLQAEGVAPQNILVTGNTGIDALLQIARWQLEAPALAAPLPLPAPGRRRILATVHRRENHGEVVIDIARALMRLAERVDIDIVVPVHPNPAVGSVLRAHIGGIDHVHLVEPLDYAAFVQLLVSADLVITDSGGVQEEAPALGKPTLVVRASTERVEAIEAGVALLVGTSAQSIVDAASRLLDDAAHYARMARPTLPFGDGRAAERILDRLLAGSRLPDKA